MFGMSRKRSQVSAPQPRRLRVPEKSWSPSDVEHLVSATEGAMRAMPDTGVLGSWKSSLKTALAPFNRETVVGQGVWGQALTDWLVAAGMKQQGTRLIFRGRGVIGHCTIDLLPSEYVQQPQVWIHPDDVEKAVRSGLYLDSEGILRMSFYSDDQHNLNQAKRRIAGAVNGRPEPQDGYRQ